MKDVLFWCGFNLISNLLGVVCVFKLIVYGLSYLV